MERGLRKLDFKLKNHGKWVKFLEQQLGSAKKLKSKAPHPLRFMETHMIRFKSKDPKFNQVDCPPILSTVRFAQAHECPSRIWPHGLWESEG